MYVYSLIFGHNVGKPLFSFEPFLSRVQLCVLSVCVCLSVYVVCVCVCVCVCVHGWVGRWVVVVYLYSLVVHHCVCAYLCPCTMHLYVPMCLHLCVWCVVQ